MISAEQLSGALWLRPGQLRPNNLRSTRPDWVGRITRDRLASSLPTTLGSLFSLCSHAHIACAGLAVDAALGRGEIVSAAIRTRLSAHTMREHVQRLWLDWPRQLAVAPAAEHACDVLARCPVFAPMPVPAQAAQWLQSNAIGMPLAEWLADWECDPTGWLQEWSRQARNGLAALLRDCQPFASTSLSAAPALRVHADAGSLRALACRLRDDGATFTRQPQWQGECAETGAWTRLHEATPQRLATPWLRLGARLAEVVRLVLPEEPARCGTAWLDIGALALRSGEAIAWVEMARGLLVHHVQLEGQGDDARVAACHVIAPTEWNFHADGAVARALEQLPKNLTADAQRQLNALVAAYDPCVRFELESHMSDEAVHA